MLVWRELIVEPIKEMLAKVLGYVPTLVGALVILIIGWIVAKVIKGLVSRGLKLIQFDKLVEKAGIPQILTKGGVKLTARELLSALAYWLVMIMVLIMVVNALGLTVSSNLLEGLLAYVPNVIAAVFALVLGMFLANFVSGIVRTAASNANLPKPELLGGITQWAIVIFTITVSLKELGIAPLLVTSTFNIFFGAVCLALALAFGLGGKETAARYLEELRERRSERQG